MPRHFDYQKSIKALPKILPAGPLSTPQRGQVCDQRPRPRPLRRRPGPRRLFRLGRLHRPLRSRLRRPQKRKPADSDSGILEIGTRQDQVLKFSSVIFLLQCSIDYFDKIKTFITFTILKNLLEPSTSN